MRTPGILGDTCWPAFIFGEVSFAEFAGSWFNIETRRQSSRSRCLKSSREDVCQLILEMCLVKSAVTVMSEASCAETHPKP